MSHARDGTARLKSTFRSRSGPWSDRRDPVDHTVRVLGVIDYRTGNSSSVIHALRAVGVPATLLRHPDQGDRHELTGVVLPGVGAAGTTMAYLRDLGWVDFLETRVRAGGLPYLGICVGLQILFERSDEQNAECLGWLPGKVVGFDSCEVRVPHIGWNTVEPVRHHPVFASIDESSAFYFINSYYLVPGDPEDTVGRTEYGAQFASVVAHDNLLACQFHVEKSGPAGLRVLRAFGEACGAC